MSGSGLPSAVPAVTPVPRPVLWALDEYLPVRTHKAAHSTEATGPLLRSRTERGLDRVTFPRLLRDVAPPHPDLEQIAPTLLPGPGGVLALPVRQRHHRPALKAKSRFENWRQSPKAGRHWEHDDVRGNTVPKGISTTDQLEPHEWSNEETAAYEAAIEAVNGAVGAYSAVISAEESKTNPDQNVIADALAAQARLAREREGLRSSDREQIAAARARYAQLAREVMAGIT
ncbi:hypothetical protein SUDANB99_05967 (plasmid) [Streptomyces sp. enrichment culture]